LSPVSGTKGAKKAATRRTMNQKPRQSRAVQALDCNATAEGREMLRARGRLTREATALQRLEGAYQAPP
jgi:hypothetical protein